MSSVSTAARCMPICSSNMQPYDRRLSYPVLQSIISQFSFRKRMDMSKCSKEFRKIQWKVPIRLNRVHFHHPLLSDAEPSRWATLDVDGVMYWFNRVRINIEYRLRITCSLSRKSFKEKQNEETRTIAQHYFRYFLQFPIEHLQITGCGQLFKPGDKLSCKTLTWDFAHNLHLDWLKFLYTDESGNERIIHRFERLELRFNRPDGYNRKLDWSSKCVVTYGYILEDPFDRFVYGHNFWGINFGKEHIVRCVSKQYNDLMLTICDTLEDDRMNGSWKTHLFDYSPNRKTDMWERIRNEFEGAEESEKDCILVRKTGKTAVVVFYEYDTLQNKESFTCEKFTLLTESEARQCAVFIWNVEWSKSPLDFHRFDIAKRISDGCGVVQAEQVLVLGSGPRRDLRLQFVNREDVEKVVSKFEGLKRSIEGCSGASAHNRPNTDGNRFHGIRFSGGNDEICFRSTSAFIG